MWKNLNEGTGDAVIGTDVRARSIPDLPVPEERRLFESADRELVLAGWQRNDQRSTEVVVPHNCSGPYEA